MLFLRNKLRKTPNLLAHLASHLHSYGAKEKELARTLSLIMHGVIDGVVDHAMFFYAPGESAGEAQVSKYIMNSQGWGRSRRFLTSRSVLYQIQVSMTSSVKTSPRSRKS